jgi:peptide/nickel transport system permease protein
MGQYIIKRVLQMIPVFFIVTVAVFVVTRLLPGDIAVTIIGETVTDEQRALIAEEYGLNDSIVVQYVRWLGQILTGDFGRSYRSHERVTVMLRQRFPATLELTIFSMLVAISIGVPVGIITSTKRNSLGDITATILSMVGMAIPVFWLGILFILLFSLKLRVLPPSGYIPFTKDPVSNLRLMILPTLTLGIALAAVIMRQTRGAMLSILNQPYIDTARAKGLTERGVNIRHALRNALIPVATVIGLQTGTLLGGAVITETVFSIPGMGRMLVQGIFSRDYPVIQGGVIVFVIIVLIINVTTDIVYAVLDPRIKFK